MCLSSCSTHQKTKIIKQNKKASVELNPGVANLPPPPNAPSSSLQTMAHVFFHTLCRCWVYIYSIYIYISLSPSPFPFFLFSQRLASCYFYTFDRPTGTNAVFTFHGCVGRQTGKRCFIFFSVEYLVPFFVF